MSSKCVFIGFKFFDRLSYMRGVTYIFFLKKIGYSDNAIIFFYSNLFRWWIEKVSKDKYG
jgi:DNA primase large subunit